MRWSTVWSSLAQTHSGDCVILNRCRYALVILCPVTIAVKLGVRLIFFFSLSLTSGKYTLYTNLLALFSYSTASASLPVLCLPLTIVPAQVQVYPTVTVLFRARSGSCFVRTAFASFHLIQPR